MLIHVVAPLVRGYNYREITVWVRGRGEIVGSQYNYREKLLDLGSTVLEIIIIQYSSFIIHVQA